MTRPKSGGIQSRDQRNRLGSLAVSASLVSEQIDFFDQPLGRLLEIDSEVCVQIGKLPPHDGVEKAPRRLALDDRLCGVAANSGTGRTP